MESQTALRHYTEEEKRQLIANLDIEVAHRTRQFEAWLADQLENFTMHQEGQVSRIPKQVRTMTMREFGEKYDGNIQSALRGFQKEKLAAAGADATLGEIDKSMRKRKWVASQETEAETSGSSQFRGADSQRTSKNARIQLLSPKKVAGSSIGPGTAQRARMLAAASKTPGNSRVMGRTQPSPNSQLLRPLFIPSSTSNPRPHARPPSPSKRQPSNFTEKHAPTSRVPSSSTFNPTLPTKTPVYPDPPNTTMRLPRKDENMLSINGSPLANPYDFGLGWFKGVEMDVESQEQHEGPDAQQTSHIIKRNQSSIIIRRDPSVALSDGLHSRTNSQASFYTASSQATSSSHSRENSQVSQPIRMSSEASIGPFRFPAIQSTNSEATPRPAKKHNRTFSALVAIPTTDGHFLEFDPLQTSPGTLDALEGISDSAKKQAKIEMGRLIQATVDKWQIR
ncbi:hypothetical protein BDN70DRAFT_883455 [Pholiota conissans]|uniref:Borealin N-terminal domain-containing protein n=1 Tax=Pholiota conissans TaxID=109636 RepID=A0A9P6CXJ1_9AGAR|nr:hypothetical protein BDN70DRAFT_883455 [Pholiota conissans]